MSNAFRDPPELYTASGEPRRLGIEIEFSGLGLEETSELVASSLNGTLMRRTEAEHTVSVPDLGDFTVEVYWQLLKTHAAKQAQQGNATSWVSPARELSSGIVPIEVVWPAITLERLNKLPPMIETLRRAGAKGTNSSPIASFGLHLNPETPDLNGPTLHSVLRAFCLLQDWLVETHDVDLTRRIGPHIDRYPMAYRYEVHDLDSPDIRALAEHYVTHNRTRNRALDILPILAEHDADFIACAVADDRVKPRPAFHYRLPNCEIDQEHWQPSDAWHIWCVVEELASDSQALERMTSAFQRIPIDAMAADSGVWRAQVAECLENLELA